MPLESGNQIQDLNPSWPTGADPKSQGDDHLRLIKACVLGSFPGMSAPWVTSEPITPGTPTQEQHAAKLANVNQVQQNLDSLEARTPVRISAGYWDGSIQGGSGDFTINNPQTGEYEIIFNDAASATAANIVTVSPVNVPPFTFALTLNVLPVSPTQVNIYAENDNNGNAVAANFMFNRMAY